MEKEMEKKKETEKKEIKKERKSVRIVDLEGKEALSAFMSNDLYCTTELPEYFDFSGVLEYAARLRWTAGPLLSALSAERLNSTDRKPLLFAHFPSGARPQRRV